MEKLKRKLAEQRGQKEIREKEEKMKPIDKIEIIEATEEISWEYILDHTEVGPLKDVIFTYESKIGEEIPEYKKDQRFYYEFEPSDQDESDEVSIMERFLKECQEEICINNEDIETRTRELLNTR